MSTKCCTQCGRSDRTIVKGLCPRHLAQEMEYGADCILDDNPRDEFDLNEIIIHEDYAEIVLYDNFFNELENRVVIDLDDVDEVKNIIWKKNGKTIIGHANQYTFILPNLLLDTDMKVEHLDGNIYNNKRSNLDIIQAKTGKHFFSKKHKNKIIVTAIGNSKEDVTGSCFAIEYSLDNGNRDLILLECGAIQTNRIQDDYIANKKMVENIPFNLASALFVCHSHADHIANIPSGITRGFQGKIISNYANSEIMKPMLLDGAFIHNRNVASLNNKGKKFEPLYDESDTYSMLSKIEVYEENEIHRLNSNLSFRFTPNNHSVGACQLELFIKKPSGRVVKIAYTSDLGSDMNMKFRPYSKTRENISKANLLLIESTYGEQSRSFTKKDAEKESKELLELIKHQVYSGHRILIPSFSYDRAQSLMTFIYDNFKDDKKFKKVKVIVDSRLLNTINEVYRSVLDGEMLDKWNEVMSWKNFIFIDEYKRTEIMAMDKDSPYIILSSSGMMSGGHVTTYAKSILPNKHDCIAFVGYCSPSTLGGKIQQEDKKSVNIDGVNIPIRCEVKVFHTFTGHAMACELISYMKGINCDSIYLHHGSRPAKEQLKFNAEEAFLFSGISKKVRILDKKNNQIYL